MHPEQAPSQRFFAPLAWLQGAWARDVLLSVDEAGLWSAITPNTSLSERQGATVLAGPVLPGVVNAHSHAFQRAMAGLTEQRGTSASGGNVINDDFWSWRDRMYSVALRISPEQLEHIDKYLKSGKPIMGFRTTTHAFNFPKGNASERWNAFGEFALNAPPGWGGKAAHTHYGHESSTDVSVIEAGKNHPILTGVAPNFHVRSWLYRVLPDYPTKGSEWLLMGKSVNPDKAAIENPVAWTGTNSFGAKVFTTTMGHPEDFQVEAFQRLVINAIHWELGKKIPKNWKGKIDINVPYRGMVK